MCVDGHIPYIYRKRRGAVQAHARCTSPCKVSGGHFGQCIDPIDIDTRPEVLTWEEDEDKKTHIVGQRGCLMGVV